MAKEKEQPDLEESIFKAPANSDLPEPDSQKEVSKEQVFAGDEDFYNFLADSVQPTVQHRADVSKWKPRLDGLKNLSKVQKTLVISIIAIGAMLLYVLIKPPHRLIATPPLRSTDQTAPANQEKPPEKPPVAESTQAVRSQTPEPELPPTQPLSLKVAQNFYVTGDYNKAYAVYERLRKGLQANPHKEFMSDFLQLRMALCANKTADSEQANRLFRMVSQSRCPVVRIVANYHRGLIEIQNRQYLRARTRAYQAIGLIDGVEINREQTLSLKRDCHFLLAESVTRVVLELCDADKDAPAELWSRPKRQEDPFSNLDEAQLKSFLNSGAETLSKALLSPQIQHTADTGGSARYTVTCHKAPLEELLARFTANAGLDLHWAVGSDATAVRKRAVNLHLSELATQQIACVAAGCAGLCARINNKNTVSIFNPLKYSSLSEHTSVLTTEAVSLWQRFVLMFHDDKLIPNAHFALALLQVQKGRLGDAIAEYKLVANRFSQSSLSPFALLNSSKLKNGLRDYSGARQDLKQIVEQHPDSELADQAYLYLADATAKVGHDAEAIRLYRKVYNLNSSVEAQRAAALGAGTCFYRITDYEAAAKWLSRYINLAKVRKSRDLYSAYFRLGKTNMALGKPQKACDAFQRALAGKISRQQYIETISALVEAHTKQGNLVKALGILEDTHYRQLSQKNSVQILLLKSRILRTMGLVDKAIESLEDRAEYTPDPQLKAQISFELTECYIAEGDFELARRKLAEILTIIEPGPLARKIALKLANVCLKLGQDSQAISVCSQLLALEPREQISQQALNILATAYRRQKDYDRAALALLGHCK